MAALEGTHCVVRLTMYLSSALHIEFALSNHAAFGSHTHTYCEP